MGNSVPEVERWPRLGQARVVAGILQEAVTVSVKRHDNNGLSRSHVQARIRRY